MAMTELTVSAGTHFPQGEVYPRGQGQGLAGAELESEALRGPVWFRGGRFAQFQICRVQSVSVAVEESHWIVKTPCLLEKNGHPASNTRILILNNSKIDTQKNNTDYNQDRNTIEVQEYNILLLSSNIFVPSFPCGSAGKESTCNEGNLGLIPGLGRSPGEGKGYPLQYSGLKNSMDYIVHGVTKS